MNRRITRILLTSVILSMVAIAAIGTATATNNVYFAPQDGSAACDGATTVELRVNANDLRGGELEFTYAAGCCEVTGFDDSPSDFPNVGWGTNIEDGRERITFYGADELIGDKLIGTLTIECNSDACDTNLLFDGAMCELFDGGYATIGDATWTDGTFTCGEGSTDNNVYFTPQDGSAACDGATTVELRVNANDLRGGELEFTYAAGCCEVTGFDDSPSDFPNVGWGTNIEDGRERITFYGADELIGDKLIGTLTIECNSDACDTNLLFDGAKCILFDSAQEISATWTDGTFACTSQSTYYGDGDGDGFGDPNDSVVAASAPAGYVEDNTDCNDNDPNVNPGMTEITCNGKDDDCNAATLDNPDGDGDGVGVCDDCNDGNVAVWQLLTGYTDGDNDSYGTGDAQQICSGASLPSGYATQGGDCDDTNAAVNPGANEICGNGIDDNCNNQTDEGCCICDFCMPLEAGLNLVSVPRPVEVGSSSKASAVFNLSRIETCECYDGCTGKWSNSPPTQMQIVPDRAYFVYKVNAETLCLNGTTYLGQQELCANSWAMVGFPSLEPKTVAEFSAASNLDGKFLTAWQWNDGWYPAEDMVPYRGYVLWMTENGSMPGLIA